MGDTCHIEDSHREALASRGLVRAADFLAFEGGETVTRSRTTATRRFEAGGRRFFLKKWTHPTLGDRWRTLFRGGLLGRTKAFHEWNNLGRLRSMGVGAPDRAAWGEARKEGFLLGCFLATGEIEDAEPLDEILRAPPDPGLIERLGRWALHLHDQGYADGSLALRNLLYRRSSTDFFKVDCPKGRWGKRLPAAPRAADLAALAAGIEALAGRQGLDDFFQGYAFPPAGGKKAQAFRRRVEARSRKAAAREKARLEDRPGGGGR